MDFCFRVDEFDQTFVTVPVAIEEVHEDEERRWIVPCKGSTGSYAARMVLELINECRDKDRDTLP